MQRRAVLRGAAALSFIPAAAFGSAGLPDRPIRIILPSPPGGAGDTLARLLGAKITASTGHTVIVESKPGGNMIIGATLVANAKPDGTTLLWGGTTPSSAAGAPHPKLPYDPVSSFVPVVGIALNSYVLVAHPELPVRSVAELIALARRKPGELSFGAANESSRMAGELFKSMAGIDMLHVPYQGPVKAMTDLASGRLSTMFNGSMSTKPYVDNRQVRALGISSPTRDTVYPDVPPIGETVRDYKFLAWQALMAPADTPPVVLQALTAMFTAAINDPEVVAKFAGWGLTHWPAQPDEVARMVREDLEMWRRLVKQANIAPITR